MESHWINWMIEEEKRTKKKWKYFWLFYSSTVFSPVQRSTSENIYFSCFHVCTLSTSLGYHSYAFIFLSFHNFYFYFSFFRFFLLLILFHHFFLVLNQTNISYEKDEKKIQQKWFKITNYTIRIRPKERKRERKKRFN